jgi:hypothetical protein
VAPPVAPPAAAVAQSAAAVAPPAALSRLTVPWDPLLLIVAGLLFHFLSLGYCAMHGAYDRGNDWPAQHLSVGVHQVQYYSVSTVLPLVYPQYYLY